jgi:hypothetical protein
MKICASLHYQIILQRGMGSWQLTVFPLPVFFLLLKLIFIIVNHQGL